MLKGWREMIPHTKGLTYQAMLVKILDIIMQIIFLPHVVKDVGGEPGSMAIRNPHRPAKKLIPNDLELMQLLPL